MKPLIVSVAAAIMFSLTACHNANTVAEKDAAIQAQQHTIDSMNTELAKKKVIDSMNEVSRIQYVVPQQIGPGGQPLPAQAVATTHREVRHHYSGRSGSQQSQQVAQQSQAVQQQPAVAQRRGWSGKAKGAVFGAGAGALAGALINGRNRAAGAVIGGVSGAAVGTGIGAIIDRKNGR